MKSDGKMKNGRSKDVPVATNDSHLLQDEDERVFAE